MASSPEPEVPKLPEEEDDEYEDVDEDVNGGVKPKLGGWEFPKFKGMTTRSRVKKVPQRYKDDMFEASQRLAETEAELARLKKQMAVSSKSPKSQSQSAGKLMPARYSGTADFDEYLIQFEVIAEVHGWSSQEKASVLMAKLDGPALAVAAPIASQGFEVVTKKLKGRFAPEQQEACSLQLRTRSQNKGETYEALADDVERLAKKAYPRAEEPTRCRLATDAFVNAVADDRVREKLRDRAPETIEEALRMARQLAASRELEKRRVRAVCEGEGAQAEDTEVRQLREELRQVRAELEKFRSPTGKVKKGDGKKAGPGRQWGNLVCFNCNQPGHIRRWCTQKAPVSQFYHQVTVPPNANSAQQTATVGNTAMPGRVPPAVAVSEVPPSLNSQGQIAASHAP